MYTIHDILESLKENLSAIHTALGPTWADFYRELTPVIGNCVNVTDRRQLNEAADRVWEVCSHYPAAIDKLVGYLFALPKRSQVREKDSVSIFEIANRFQTVLDCLKALEPTDRGSTQGSEEVNEPVRPDAATEEVRFTMFHPLEAVADRWYSALVYVHLESALRRVRKDARKFADEMGHTPREVTNRRAARLARGTEVQIVLAADGVEFNPPALTLTWNEDLERAAFRLRAAAELVGQPCFGEMDAYVGPLLVASLQFSIHVTDAPPKSETKTKRELLETGAKMYQNIFVSYSHQDTSIVKACARAFQAIGYEVLVDYEMLRSGQRWQEGLKQLIEKADIFQLLWSNQSAQSKYVRKEWEYALSLECAKQTQGVGFIRPVYWEEPMPKIPPKLAHIHFKYMPSLGRLTKGEIKYDKQPPETTH